MSSYFIENNFNSSYRRFKERTVESDEDAECGLREMIYGILVYLLEVFVTLSLEYIDDI